MTHASTVAFQQAAPKQAPLRPELKPSTLPSLRLVSFQLKVEGRQPDMTKIDGLFFHLLEGNVGKAITMVEDQKNLVPYLTAYLTDPDRKVQDNARVALAFISGRADWEMRIRLNVSLSKFRFSKWMDKLSHEDTERHETIKKDIDSILTQIRTEIPS